MLPMGFPSCKLGGVKCDETRSRYQSYEKNTLKCWMARDKSK